MTPRDFIYWLQGYFELSETNILTEEQVIEIKKHLYNCFKHECEQYEYDPSTGCMRSKTPLNFGMGIVGGGQLLNDVKPYYPEFSMTPGVSC